MKCFEDKYNDNKFEHKYNVWKRFWEDKLKNCLNDLFLKLFFFYHDLPLSTIKRKGEDSFEFLSMRDPLLDLRQN